MGLLFLFKKEQQKDIIIINTLNMYTIILRFLFLVLHFPLIIPRKYRNWLYEQKKISKKLKENKQKSIWLHCASLGEYEHIKVLIPELKKINKLITITFFSNSGYENFRDHHLIRQVLYLPVDFKSNMNRFIELINPMMVIVSKNDVWPNMATCIKNKEIPFYLVGAKLKKSKMNSFLHRVYYHKYFSKFSYIFCQDQLTYDFLKNRKIAPCVKISDLRIAQVVKDKQKLFVDKKIETFIKNKKTVIYGSVEKNDYDIIINTINKRTDVQHIIIPHDINKHELNKLQSKLKAKHILYSNIHDSDTIDSNILIVDIFGILKKIYKYCEIAYIGGGFDQGVHNTLEPAIYENLILFGPYHTHFPETFFLIEKNVATVVNNKMEFEQTLNQLLYEYQEKKQNISKTISSFFKENIHNTDFVINTIKQDIM